MKQYVLLFSILFFSIQSKAQCTGNVTVPDTNLKNILVQHGKSIGGIGVSIIDTNNDNEIQCSEANSYTGSITLINRKVTNLTGLEQFKNITRLFIGYNDLTSLDITANTKLIRIDANNNNLTTLDISKNTLLESLNIDENKLTTINTSNNTSLTTLSIRLNTLSSIDLTNNTALENLTVSNNNLNNLNCSTNNNLKILRANFNQLTSLNLSNNTLLETIAIQGNNLLNIDISQNINLVDVNFRDNNFIHLDASNNSNLTQFISDNNPDLETLNVANGNNVALINMWTNKAPKLTCIEHDSGFDPTAKTNGRLWIKDNTANWSNNCNGTASVDDNATIQFKLFPNPAIDFINISTNTEIEKGEIFNILGKKVIEFKEKNINVSNLHSGIYLIKLQNKNGYTVMQKLLKK